MFREGRRTEPGVGKRLARDLALAGSFDARAHRSAGFTAARSEDLVVRECRHLDTQIDAIEQRPGQLCPIARVV